MKLNGFTADYKIWLEKDGAIFGDGLGDLLSNIAGFGSIARAARELGMSYRAAWGKIRVAEKIWGIPLVFTRVGGEAGGWAKLTPEAHELLKTYCRLQQEVEEFVQNLPGKFFKGH